MGQGGQVRPSDEKNTTFPSAVEAFFLFVALFVVEYVLGLALFDARAVLGLSSSQLMVMVMLLGNGVLLSAILHFKGLGYRGLLHPTATSPWATAVFLVPLLLLLVPGLMLCLQVVVEWVTVWFPLSRAEEAMFSRMDGQDLATALAVCVVAPVVEEMLFRGVVLRSFLQQYDRRQAIWGSALLFAVAHLNIYQFVVALGMGLVLGWLYERSRSLIPCIALHAAYNTGTGVLAQAMGEGRDAAVASLPISVWAAALGAAALAVLGLRRLLVGAGAVVARQTDA
jgi:membrane protease YdiL (CAAX protease family)